MKVFALDWQGVLATLGEWEALTPGGRRAFLLVRPSQGVSTPELGGAVDELREAGLVTATAKRAVIVPRYHALLLALRAMGRVPVHDHANALLVPGYLQEHFTDEEMARVAGRPVRSYGWVERADVAGIVASSEYAAEFLALEGAAALAKWEAARLLPGEAPRLADPALAAALQGLVRALAEHPRGIPLRELRTHIPAPDHEFPAAVLEAGIRGLVLFPSLRGSVEAVVGLAPGVAERLGPPPPPPAAVDAAEAFEGAWRVGDMTTVLVEAASTPIPLRGSDGGMYVRSQKQLAPRLQPVPAWAEVALGLLDAPGDAEAAAALAEERLADRTTAAAHLLLELGLARAATDEDKKHQLRATKRGREWLALDEGERVRAVLDVFRDPDQRNPDGWYGVRRGGAFFPARIAFDLPRDTALDLRAALTDAFLSIPEDGMVPLGDFLRFHARNANPFVAHGMHRGVGRTVYASLRPVSREGWEEMWARMLLEFAAERLFPFGGARAGLTDGDEAALGLTPAGRYLLGATDTFRHEDAPAGEVVVQPDFEVLFLAPAPRLEPELARIADRIGSGVGALFRITRASVLRAAEQGIAGDDAVALLERVSRTPVPANVARQIRDWVGATRQVSLHTALLIECPDAETAARVLALTAGHGQLVTPTLLRLPPHALDRKTFLKKLREKGIFVTA